MFRPARLAIASAIAVQLVAGCAGRQPQPETSEGEVELGNEHVFVKVQNSYASIVDVYAVARGVKDRLGTVGMGSPQTFKVSLRHFPPDAEIQIVARPIGENGTATSGPLTVRGGYVIEFTVSPTLTGSVLMR